MAFVFCSFEGLEPFFVNKGGIIMAKPFDIIFIATKTEQLFLLRIMKMKNRLHSNG